MRFKMLALAVVAAVGMLALAGGTARAAPGGIGHTITSTQNIHGAQTFVATNPCTGNLVDISSVDNIVMHITYFPASDEHWFTFTDESKFQATDRGTGVVYTGHATFWGNDNVNKQNANSTFTSTIVARGDDGSTIRAHDVAHFTLNANGELTVTFEKPNLTCTP